VPTQKRDLEKTKGKWNSEMNKRDKASKQDI